MKKLVVMAVMALAVASASAVEVCVRGTHSSGADNTAAGVTIGQKFGPVGVEGAFDRTTRGSVNTNKFSVTGSYDVATFYGIVVAPKAGVAFIDTANSGSNGYAAIVGVGATYPLTKQVSLTADYYYQKAQTSFSSYDGNYFAFGAKYSF